ncbi:transglycosylase SLT domain-containing protein [Acidisoma sp. 7E03]
MARRALLSTVLVAVALACRAPLAQAGSLDAAADSSALCGAAVQAASDQYSLPSGLLHAISLVESGRPSSIGGRRAWPWTVQAEGESHYFPTKTAAVQWVAQAQNRGVSSIDVGCMQINLMYHPNAFRSLEDAFDPAQNALYAARFLTVLHGQTGDWREAAGRYHSETLALALPYRRQVEAILVAGGGSGLSPAALRLAALQSAWDATLSQSAAPTDQNADGATLSGDWTSLRPVPKARKPHRLHASQPILLSDAR